MAFRDYRHAQAWDLLVVSWECLGCREYRIEVTNLSANRIRDLEIRKVNWKIMHDANIVTPAYKSFDGSKWPIQPSGLLGPVRLTPIELLHLTRS